MPNAVVAVMIWSCPAAEHSQALEAKLRYSFARDWCGRACSPCIASFHTPQSVTGQSALLEPNLSGTTGTSALTIRPGSVGLLALLSLHISMVVSRGQAFRPQLLCQRLGVLLGCAVDDSQVTGHVSARPAIRTPPIRLMLQLEHADDTACLADDQAFIAGPRALMHMSSPMIPSVALLAHGTCHEASEDAASGEADSTPAEKHMQSKSVTWHAPSSQRAAGGHPHSLAWAAPAHHQGRSWDTSAKPSHHRVPSSSRGQAWQRRGCEQGLAAQLSTERLHALLATVHTPSRPGLACFFAHTSSTHAWWLRPPLLYLAQHQHGN